MPLIVPSAAELANELAADGSPSDSLSFGSFSANSYGSFSPSAASRHVTVSDAVDTTAGAGR